MDPGTVTYRRHDHPAVGRLPVGVEVQRPADDSQRDIECVFRRHDRCLRRRKIGVMRILEIGDPEPVVGRSPAGVDVQPPPGIGYVTTHPRRRIVGALEHQSLRSASERVIPELVVGVRVLEVGALCGAAEP
jgi:hypothetical protein